MSINFNTKTDYSYLFSNLSSSRSGNLGNLNFLSDYASIKNGSYGKLMKAYYQKVGNDSTSTSSADNSSKLTTSLSADSAKTLTQIDSDADALKESADALINKGTDSLFKEKEVTVKKEDGTTATTKEYDVDAIYDAVSSMVKNYNTLLDSTAKSDSSSVKTATSNMTNITALYSKTLEKAGITVGSDNKLTLDEEKFKATDISTLKSTFNNSPSFAYSVSSQASFIDYAANKEALKANTYDYTGTYNNNYSIGNLFNSFL